TSQVNAPSFPRVRVIATSLLGLAVQVPTRLEGGGGGLSGSAGKGAAPPAASATAPGEAPDPVGPAPPACTGALAALDAGGAASAAAFCSVAFWYSLANELESWS